MKFTLTCICIFATYATYSIHRSHTVNCMRYICDVVLHKRKYIFAVQALLNAYVAK